MLKSLFGSVSARRHRQSAMVAAQVSPLERRELLDGTTGYGSYDPYGTSSSGSGSSSGGGGMSSSGAPGSPSTGSLTVRLNENPNSYIFEGAYSMAENTSSPITSTQNSQYTSSPLASPPGGSTASAPKSYTNAVFEVDIVFNGAPDPKLEVTATNGDENWHWIEDVSGETYTKSLSFPVGNSDWVKLDVKLFSPTDGFTTTGHGEVAVMTATVSAREIAANAGIEPGRVKNGLYPKIDAPIHDMFEDVRQNGAVVAERADAADFNHGDGYWAANLNAQLMTMENALKLRGHELIDNSVDMFFGELDAKLQIRYAVSNTNVFAMNEWKVFVSQKLTAAANAVPFGNYVNIIGVPSMPSLADIIVNEAATGSLNNVDDALKVHVGSLGMNMSIPFDLPDVNGNIVHGYVGGSAAYNFFNGQAGYAVTGGMFAPVIDHGNWGGGFRISAQHLWAKDPSGVYIPGIFPLPGFNVGVSAEYNWRDFRPQIQIAP